MLGNDWRLGKFWPFSNTRSSKAVLPCQAIYPSPCFGPGFSQIYGIKFWRRWPSHRLSRDTGDPQFSLSNIWKAARCKQAPNRCSSKIGWLHGMAVAWLRCTCQASPPRPNWWEKYRFHREALRPDKRQCPVNTLQVLRECLTPFSSTWGCHRYKNHFRPGTYGLKCFWRGSLYWIT